VTYSIVARDPETGHMGVAAQSQAFAVGSSVPWALPGFGVVATQSMGEPMYGELGLGALRSGLTAAEALTALRSVDPHPERRQVAMVDSYGGIDVYTGEACVAAAGHARGDGCAALANLMATDGVWDAMVGAYEVTGGPLEVRLLAALQAAEAEGGDLRGRRSVAMLVVRAERSGRPWQDQLVDLRVDDHPEPLEEFERMLHYGWRYRRTAEAFELALDGHGDAALDRLGQAAFDPDTDVEVEPELVLWRAIALGAAGRVDEARSLLADLDRVAPAFVESARRFGPARLVDPDLLERVLPPTAGR
jgi:uncharacterized Ntn-hydrolase superfamily protein